MEFKKILPDLPPALQLPLDPNLSWADLIARDAYLKVFTKKDILVNIEEKVDGSSVAITVQDKHPLIRNKDRLLQKGETAKSPNKKQYASIWNWFYKNKDKFDDLESILGPCSVYGEWMWMQHGLEYDALPSWFIAFDIFHHKNNRFLSPQQARPILEKTGFCLAQNIPHGELVTFGDYVDLVEGPSAITTKGNREGIYIKITDPKEDIYSFKMVRRDFIQGALFTDKVLKNRLL